MQPCGLRRMAAPLPLEPRCVKAMSFPLDVVLTRRGRAREDEMTIQPEGVPMRHELTHAATDVAGDGMGAATPSERRDAHA
jgi:hypothetical protein